MNEETRLEIQNAVSKGFSNEEVVEALDDVTLEDVEKVRVEMTPEKTEEVKK